MGRGGFYYRRSLNAPNDLKQTPVSVTDKPAPGHAPVIPDGMTEIESADISQMQDISSIQLLEEINEKRKKSEIFPIALCVYFFTLVYLIQFPAWFLAIAMLGGSALVYIKQFDKLRKAVVVLYDLEDISYKAYSELCEQFDTLKEAKKIWHLEAEGRVDDTKRNAGATSRVTRTPIWPRIKEPLFIQTNITCPMIPVGKQEIYLLPDRILVTEKEKVGAVAYIDLYVTSDIVNFVESGEVPADTETIGKTWLYVNKSGGPDKRYKDNKELPIVRYIEIYFKSSSGLNECLQISDTAKGNNFAVILSEYSKSL